MNELNTYEEYKAELKSEQSNMSRDEIKQQMQQQSEATFDLDNFPSVKHNWVERGAVISCEGANHPNHRHFLTKR